MNQTIYFQKDIWDKFKDEPFKSKVINELLKESYNPISTGKVNTPSDSVSITSNINLGRACCIGKNRCQHWLWNDTQAAYVNTLTGEVRDAD